MLLKNGPTLACALTLAAAFSLPKLAKADPLCDDLNLPHKVYGVGGSAVTGTLMAISQAIADDPNNTDDRTTIIYHDDLGACDGYQAFLSGKVTGSFRYRIKGSTADQRCDARIGGQPVDFSHMGNDWDFCPGGSLPEGTGSFVGPIETLNFVTAKASNQLSISAEALYFIYGFGATGQAAPWTDGTGVFQRQSTSFASLFAAAVIDVPSAAFKWTTNEQKTQGDVAKQIVAYAKTEELAGQTLGYMSGNAADTRRSTLRTLAYRHYDQTCAVYPDSTAASRDKINVRTGKYFPWTPGHYFTKVDAKGKPLNDRVENLIGWASAKTTALGTTVNAFEQTIIAGDIPQCAMQVQREGTLGAFSSYADPKPCSCYFEHTNNPTVTSACTPCTTDAQCGGDTPACNFGYCEAYRAPGEVEG